MQTTIAHKIKEIDIEQKLAMIKTINEQKDSIDQTITKLNYLSESFPTIDALRQLLDLLEQTSSTPDILPPTKVFIDKISQVTRHYLEARREQLISQAEDLMK